MSASSHLQLPASSMRWAIIVLMAALAAPSLASAETFSGRASVIDGDTIEVAGKRMRILDIDAPETRQLCFYVDGDVVTGTWRCGQRAALALSDWIGARTVVCESDKLDGYKRHLARCAVAGSDIATWLAENGWAMPFRNCKCEVIRQASARAQGDKRGIWVGRVEEPWQWRKVN